MVNMNVQELMSQQVALKLLPTTDEHLAEN